MHAIALLFALTIHPVPYTLERLELNLTVDYQQKRIDGGARLTVRNTSDQPVQMVPILLGRLMKVNNANGLAFEQTIATFEDEPMRQVNAVTLHLSKPLAPGKSTTVSLDYGGYIVGYTETGNLYVMDRVAEDFTIIREDAYSFPALGVLSRAVNRKISRSDFTYDAQITVPKGYIVGAGALVDTKDVDGKTTFHFASDVPVPFINFPIAKFKTLDEGGVRVYYLPEDEAGAKVVMQKTHASLDLLTKWFGPLHRTANLTIIEIPENWGSQAALIPGIILTADDFKDPRYETGLYHEIAHLWNGIENEKPLARLNEGQSMWLQWIMSEELDGLKPDWIPKAEKRAADRAMREPRLATISLADYGAAGLTDYSYGVGELYFAALEKAIGRDALFGVLRDYYQSHPNGATVKDFTTLLEQRFPQTATIDADWIYSTRWRESVARP